MHVTRFSAVGAVLLLTLGVVTSWSVIVPTPTPGNSDADSPSQADAITNPLSDARPLTQVATARSAPETALHTPAAPIAPAREAVIGHTTIDDDAVIDDEAREHWAEADHVPRPENDMDLQALDEMLAMEAEDGFEYDDPYDDWDTDVEAELYADDYVDDGGDPAVRALGEPDDSVRPTGFASDEILAGYPDKEAPILPIDSPLGEHAVPDESRISQLPNDEFASEVDQREINALASFDGLVDQPARHAMPKDVPPDSHPPTD